MNKIIALAGIVITELYRRKDFYVLFVLTALLTVVTWAVHFFHDDKIIHRHRAKDACLLLIWVSTLVIAGLSRPHARSRRSGKRAPFFPLLGQAGFAGAGHSGQVSWLLAGHGHCLGRVLCILCRHHRVPRTDLAGGRLFSGGLDAVDDAGHRHWLGAAGFHLSGGAIIYFNDRLCGGGGDSGPGFAFEYHRAFATRTDAVHPVFHLYIASSRTWNGSDLA